MPGKAMCKGGVDIFGNDTTKLVEVEI